SATARPPYSRPGQARGSPLGGLLGDAPAAAWYQATPWQSTAEPLWPVNESVTVRVAPRRPPTAHPGRPSIVDQPRPTNGMVVAVMVRNRTLASSGSPAMNSTASATWAASKVGSRVPLVISVAALPISICPHAMPYGRPSRAIDRVRPVTACLVAV